MSAPTEAVRRALPTSRRPRPRGTPPPRADLPRRIVRALRHAAPAIYGYACVRLFCLLVVSFWAHREGQGLWPILATSWDSSWYLGIAENGYARELGTTYDANNLAFFPLYPLAVRGLSWALPGSSAGVGLLVAVVGSFFAAWGIFAVGARLHGRRVGVCLALLWGGLPVGLVQWMGYTESLFTAFAAWSLYACLTGRWVWAGTLASLAGLTRPTGVALAAAVSLGALVSLWGRFSWRVLVGGLLAPLGWLSYVGWVGLRLGRWDGYFAVQELWHNHVDGGAYTLRRLDDHFIDDSTPELFLILVSLVLVASAMLFVRCVLDRQPLVLLVFTGLLLAIVLGSGGVYFSRARFLLPGFPLLLPLAVLLARASLRHAVVWVGGVVLVAAYCGGYMVLVWPSAP
ncbi:hypothetical protein QIS99_04865 [Streptomyces sp. B-S-A8]|uniref:Integral membrane protein n=1 Tax=Streptomyces solicavernae TaxID=3043614 RepID=A0ABT6RMA4_9ACTN|nr:hypothetical protein [Streptomyces sp. B-S-A8]MDI3385549.1 hypothetical protein [Streptomyces sp. B-S-A8]